MVGETSKLPGHPEKTWLPRPDENQGAADGRKDPLDGKNTKLGIISSQDPKPVKTILIFVQQSWLTRAWIRFRD
jgi:hypothetical protein